MADKKTIEFDMDINVEYINRADFIDSISTTRTMDILYLIDDNKYTIVDTGDSPIGFIVWPLAFARLNMLGIILYDKENK